MIEQIQKCCNGEWLLNDAPGARIEELAIDTRSIEQPANALFIALKTSLRDGHTFLENAWQKGVRNFLVSEQTDTTRFKGANIIIVKDTLTALQKIAAAHRKQFHIPV